MLVLDSLFSLENPKASKEALINFLNPEVAGLEEP